VADWRDNAIVRYFRETWVELKKVRWPTRKEAMNLTLVVLGVTIGMAALLGSMDAMFSFEFQNAIIAKNPIYIGIGVVVLVVGLIALVFALRKEA
jgi:preprotein translocase subunit SecE